MRNIWLLMLYASELFRHLEQRKIKLEASPDDLPDLIGELLVHAVETRLRRNLTLRGRPKSANLSRVRGRIDVLETASHFLLNQGKVACHFQEMTIDIPRNRIVRAALERLASIANPSLARRCRKMAHVLANAGVSRGRPSNRELEADPFGRMDQDDRFMVAAARLAFDLVIPTEIEGAHFLVAPDRDIVWLRTLFEKGVSGFYETVLSPQGWRIHPQKSIDWNIESQTSGITKILPGMRTDITLDSPSPRRRIVIDTKFTSLLTKGWYRDEVVKSGYIYQIYAYLRSQENHGDDLANTASGILLYPSVGRNIDESAVIQGHSMRFATIDLGAEMDQIRSQLIKIVQLAGN